MFTVDPRPITDRYYAQVDRDYALKVFLADAVLPFPHKVRFTARYKPEHGGWCYSAESELGTTAHNLPATLTLEILRFYETRRAIKNPEAFLSFVTSRPGFATVLYTPASLPEKARFNSHDNVL